MSYMVPHIFQGLEEATGTYWKELSDVREGNDCLAGSEQRTRYGLCACLLSVCPYVAAHSLFPCTCKHVHNSGAVCQSFFRAFYHASSSLYKA